MAKGQQGTSGRATAMPPIPWRLVLGLFVASRFWQAAVGMAALHAARGVPLWDAGELLGLACRWDCGWYLGIIDGGYGVEASAQPGATNWPFYPLYPILVGAMVHAAGLDPVVAGTLLSNVCLLAALGLIYRYTRGAGGSHSGGLWAVALVAFLPQGVVFSAVYTESLFLLLLVSAMLAMREQRYGLSSLAAAALSAVRSNGVFFIVFAAALLIQRFGPRAAMRPWVAPQRYLPILAAPLGAFFFWSYAYLNTGDAFAMATSVHHGWGWRWEGPLGNLVLHLRSGTFEALFWTLSSLFAFGCSFLLLRRRLYSEFCFCLAIFLLVWGGSVPNSLWRYSMVLFPPWVALGMQVADSRLLAGMICVLWLVAGSFLGWAWALGLLVSI